MSITSHACHQHSTKFQPRQSSDTVWPDSKNPSLKVSSPACRMFTHPAAPHSKHRPNSHNSDAKTAFETLQLQHRLPQAPRDTHLVTRRTPFYFPSTALEEIRVEELRAAFVVGLEEGQSDPDSRGRRLGLRGLLCIVLPRPLEEAAAQGPVQSGERNPVGLCHGYGQGLPGLTASFPLLQERPVRLHRWISPRITEGVGSRTSAWLLEFCRDMTKGRAASACCNH